MITPEALSAALHRHGKAADAYRALGITRQAVNQRSDLRAVVVSWRAQQEQLTASVTLAVSREVAVALRNVATKSAEQRGGRRPDITAVVRRSLLTALSERLPEPEPPPGDDVQIKIKLRKDAWRALQAATGKNQALSTLRAIVRQACSVTRKDSSS